MCVRLLGVIEWLDGAEDGAYEDLRKGMLDDEGYRRRVKRVRDKRFEFTAMLEQKQHSITDAGFETVESTIELAKQAKTLWLSRSPDERREFLELILSNPVLDGPTLRYEMKKPFAVLAEMAKKEDWRSQRIFVERTSAKWLLFFVTYCRLRRQLQYIQSKGLWGLFL